MVNATEAIHEKIPWFLVIILSAFLGVFGMVWLQLLPSNLLSYYSFGSIICQMNIMAAPFIVLIFSAIFSKLIGKKIALSTLTYLYVVAYTSSLYLNCYDPIEFSDVVSSRYMNEDWSAAYVPWFMAPSKDIASQLLSGHVSVPWADWIPVITYHSLLIFLLGFFFILIATLFRRQWIDIEKVPFPQALLAYELVRRFSEEKKSIMDKIGRPFFIGILLGLAFQVPVFMTVVFPWFPDVYGWKTLCASGQWYVQPGTTFASIVGLSAFQEHPAMVAIGYLAPLSISFNAWFWHLIYIVLMQVAYAMGYYSGMEGIGGCGRAWCSPSGLTEAPFKFQAVSYGGGLLGLAIFGLFRERRYIGETLRVAFQKRSSDRFDIEKREALNYRDTYLSLGLLFIAIVIFFMIAGLGFVGALLVPISYLLFWIANARMYGLAGISSAGLDHGNTLFRLMVWPTAPDPPTREFVLSAYYVRRGMDSPDAMSNGSIFTGFACYKMASLTGVKNSDVLKAMLVATVIVPLASLITYIQLCYSYGGTVFASAAICVDTNQFFNISNPLRWSTVPAAEPLASYVFAGFIIVAALELLHSRFIWFPFEPVGFIIGTTFLSVLWGYWGPFLIAWVLKTITLRVGGSKLYENLGVPIAGGFVAGNIVALIVGGIMGILKFFIPY